MYGTEPTNKYEDRIRMYLCMYIQGSNTGTHLHRLLRRGRRGSRRRPRRCRREHRGFAA